MSSQQLSKTSFVKAHAHRKQILTDPGVGEGVNGGNCLGTWLGLHFMPPRFLDHSKLKNKTCPIVPRRFSTCEPRLLSIRESQAPSYLSKHRHQLVFSSDSSGPGYTPKESCISCGPMRGSLLSSQAETGFQKSYSFLRTSQGIASLNLQFPISLTRHTSVPHILYFCSNKNQFLNCHCSR